MQDDMPQLSVLAASLVELVRALERDPRCAWTSHFQDCAAHAAALLQSGMDAAEAHTLSREVLSVYRGMGSFQDYYQPPRAGEADIDLLRTRVWDAALALRVTS